MKNIIFILFCFSLHAQSTMMTETKANNLFLHKTGNETITGVKTFSTSPVVPNSTLANSAANVQVVIDKVAASVVDMTAALTAGLSSKANTLDMMGVFATKQNTMVSGTNIKTIGGNTVLGSGNLTEVQNSMAASTSLAPTATAVINYVTFMPFTGKTAAYTLTMTDYCATLTTGSATFTLPTAVGATGKEYVFKNKSTGVLTVSGSIDGGTSRQFTTLNTGMRVISNGTTWDIIGLF